MSKANDHYDVAIIGAGIVGLATAYQLLKVNPAIKLIIIEKESEPAKHQTGNNSGVIHSGVYYKPGSLKSKNCIRGYELLLDFCKQENICLLYTSPSPRDATLSRMPSSA